MSWVPVRGAQLHPGHWWEASCCPELCLAPQGPKDCHRSSMWYRCPLLSWLPVTVHLWLSALVKQQPLKAKAGPFPEESGWLHNCSRPSTILLFSSSPYTPHHMTAEDHQCLNQQSASHLLVWKRIVESQWSRTLSSRKIKPRWYTSC